MGSVPVQAGFHIDHAADQPPPNPPNQTLTAVFELMADQGVAVYTFDAHGHGRSQPAEAVKRCLVARFDDLVSGSGGLWQRWVGYGWAGGSPTLAAAAGRCPCAPQNRNSPSAP